MSIAAGAADGAAGSIFTPLVITNTGTAACNLSTHAVVQFRDSGGNAVGDRVATPELNGPGVVTLTAGGQRQLVLRYAQAGNLDCTPTTDQTVVEVTINQTETLNLPLMDWPICPDRVADQVSLLDIA